MKCDECRAAMEDYLDDSLDERAARNVAAHVSMCVECSRLHEQLKRELAIYSSYQRDVEVTAGLWASIESRIREKPAVNYGTPVGRLGAWLVGSLSMPRLSPAFAAAMVLVAIGVTALVMNLIDSRPMVEQVAQNEPQVQPVPAPQVSPPSADSGSDSPATPAPIKQASPRPVVPKRQRGGPTPEQLVREAEQKYVQAIAILSRDVKSRRSQLDPAVVARFDAALADIDRTIAETRQAARQNPNDPIALQYLLAAYSKKVDVMRDMARD